MCVFERSRKAEMLSRTRWYKNCYNFSSLQFFNSKLGRVLCNSYSNRFCDFYISPIVGIGAIIFQSQKTGKPPFFHGVFLSPNEAETLFDFDFHKLHNMTNVFVQNLGFCRARFSIQSFFKTMPCPLKRQCENQTGVLASDSSHEYTVDRRPKTHTQTSQAICTYVLPSSKTLVNQKNILTPCTSTQRKRTKTRKRTKKELPNSYIKLLNYRHPIVRFLQKTRAWCRSKSL